MKRCVEADSAKEAEALHMAAVDRAFAPFLPALRAALDAEFKKIEPKVTQ
jgi:hypothetical protein